MEGINRYNAVFAEAVFTFVEVCKQRGYAPELILHADLGRVPGAYTGEAGLGWAFRLQQTNELHALGEDGKLYRATGYRDSGSGVRGADPSGAVEFLREKHARGFEDFVRLQRGSAPLLRGLS